MTRRTRRDSRRRGLSLTSGPTRFTPFMPKCSYCNSTILFGGVRDGGRRFCNRKCLQSGALLSVAQEVPDEVVRQRVLEIHQGACPKCQRVSVVDVHTAHSIWSALLITRWSSKPMVCCTSCGKKAKAMALLGSLFLGWWGFPWGLILTPIQIGRNLWGLARSPSTSAPSAQLERIVRLTIAEDLRRGAGVVPTDENA